MERRHFLVGVGIGVSTTSAGCLGDSPPTDGNETGNRDKNESPTSDGTDEKTIKEDPRVTEPPHKIEQPDTEGSDGWNEEYLGEHMDTEPSLTFETLPVSVGEVRDIELEGANPNVRAYVVSAVENREDYESVFDGDRLDTIDFNEHMLIFVKSGFGSGSVEHRWARVEADGGIINLHGYYTAPSEQTDDLGTRLSVLKVERPFDDFEFARVSLTVDPDRRVHFDSTEGVVTLNE